MCVPENECENEPIEMTCPENEHWVECDFCSENFCAGFGFGTQSCVECAAPSDLPPGQVYEPCCLAKNECVCDYGFYRYSGFYILEKKIRL